MASIMVIFDFDRTIIDGDSDNWVITQMGLTLLFDHYFPILPWNSLMNKMMEELHVQGKTVEDIGECLKQMPLDPQIISAIKSAHSMGCELRVVSDANQFYIETILKHHGLLDFFTEIVTNPTYIDDGRLKILPYHDFRLSPHGCSLCPSNMCKGMILERIQADSKEHGKTKFIYLGDGGGDYCPTLKLGECDYVMPRIKYPLWDRINSDPSLIKAEVHDWRNGEELNSTLLRLINTLSGDNLA
ncbi:thiamine phosphate phosphatase-like protein isoform X1 [Silene latifolia]|uniref:thiamine phosphate phosphatase-like protein isoform X1 n=1 Tax=Silene latifolia TaxID=37657 RepID=UPI003D77D2AF